MEDGQSDEMLPVHPNLNDLKLEIGQVLVCWSFLEAEIRRQLTRSKVSESPLKRSIISQWRDFTRANSMVDNYELSRQFYEPVEKIAGLRNLIAHGIHSLSADPWVKDSATIVCVDPDGEKYRLTIADLRNLSAEIDSIRLSIMGFPFS